ncbi:MAG: GAF domain-containing protein [Chloroflexi bacterium]|nr:GAF domain-containing protein [Chloroflexota bacterium]
MRSTVEQVRVIERRQLVARGDLGDAPAPGRGVLVRDLVLGTSDAAIVIGATGQILDWNPAAERFFGHQSQEVVGRRCREILGCRDLDGVALCSADCPFIHGLGARRPPPPLDLLVQDRRGHLAEVSGSLMLLGSSSGGPDARALVLLRPAPSAVTVGPSRLLASSAPGALPVETGGPTSQPAPGGRGSSYPLPPGAAPTAHRDRWRGEGTDLAGTLDRLLLITGADAAEVFLAAPVGGQLVLAEHRGSARRAFRQIVQFAPGQGFPGLVAQSGDLLLSSDLPHDDRYLREQVKAQGFRFYLCVPIWGSHGLLGSLHIASRRHPEAVVSQRLLLTGLARHLAVALELARLRAAETAGQQPHDPTLDPAANLRELAHQGVQALVHIADVDCGALLVSKGRGERSEALALVGEEGVPPRLQRAMARLCDDVSCPAIAQQRCILPVGRDPADSPLCRAVQRGLGSTLCLPLAVGGRPFGVVLLGSQRRESLPTRHLSILHAAMDRVALTIHNALVAVRERQGRGGRLSTDSGSGLNGLPLADPFNPLVPSAARESVDSSLPRPVAPSRADVPSPADTPFLDLRCLGQFAIYRDGHPVPPERFARRRSLTLLKVLLTRYGKQIHREELIELLWPEAERRSTSDLLNVVVHYLRRGLEPEAAAGQPSRFIRTSGDYYAFDVSSPHQLDSQEFLEAARFGMEIEARGQPSAALDAYRRAIARYAGDFLEDELYSDWCALEREYLRERFLGVLRRAAQLCLDQGDLESAITYFRRALLTDSTLEDVHRALMKAFWRAGRRDEALRQYRECRAILARELGITPMPETEALRQRIAADA